MRVEVWSPDGMESAVVGPLHEVLQAENGDAIGLLDGPRFARVWLDRGDEDFLRQMLASLDVRRAANSHSESG